MTNPYLNPSRSLSLSGQIDYATGAVCTFSGAEVLSFSCTEGVRDGMLPGAVVSKSCSLTLHDPDLRFTRGLSLFDAWVTVQLEGAGEAVPLCRFYVKNVSRQDGSAFLTLSGQDVLGTFFDAPWQDDTAYPAALSAIVENVLQKAGFPAALSFPCSTHLVEQMPAWGDISLRSALSFLAQACGCFCMTDGEGRVQFVPAWDDSETPCEIFPENTFRRVLGDAVFGPLKGVQVTLKGAAKDASPLLVRLDDTPLDHTNCLYIENNPLFASGREGSRSLAVDMLSALKGMHFTRVLVSWQGDPAVTLGKRIRVWDTLGGYTDACVTSLSWQADNGFSMQTDCTYQPVSSGAGRLFTSSGGLNAALLQGEVDGALLKAGSITAQSLAASSVTAEKLNAGSVTAEKLAAQSVQAEHLQAESVTAEKLSSASVTADKLAAGAVTAEKIEGGTITADQLQAGLITADSGLISDSAIGTAQIADGSITEAKIVSLNADVIQSGTLQTDRLLLTGEGGVVYEINAASSGLSQSELTDAEYKNKLDGSVLVAKSVTAAQIAAEAITANEILSGAVTTDKLSANAVTTDKLAANSVTANKLASDVGSSLDLSSNNSVKLMVDDVRVGGTNLAADTRLMESWAKTGGTRPVTLSVDGEGFGVLAWPADANKTWARAMQSNDLRKPYSVYREKDVTVSFEFRGPEWVDNDYLLVYFYVDEGQSSYFRSASQLVRIPQTDAWKKITLSVTMTDDFFTGGTGTLRQEGLVNIFLANNCAGACEVRKFKVEIGNKATDWSPAPEDGAYTTSAVLDRTGIHLNTGGTFTVDSQNFDVDGEGKMTAKAGSIGGWEIAPGSLHSGSGTSHVRLSTEDATYAIWAGAEAASSAPFRVSRDGKVYLTKLYVTDENGNAQANPVNLSGSWWRTNRAVQTMAVEGNTLTITLYDGTTVNFKKAAVSDAEIGGYNLENSTILVTVYDENGEVALEEALPDGGLMEEVYNTGWNECIDNCSYQSQAYYISEYAPGTLYMQVNGSYTSVGSDWVKTTRATGLYAIPGKKE
ncbi:MAG: hypothetical protein IJB69_02395 [Clostridia bacterium]|nr:hypothetical protein [Clostridia bacterium]